MTRIVITGMGLYAANAHGLADFEAALRAGRSGIRFHQKLQELGFGCQVGGIPEGLEQLKERYFTPEALLAMNTNMMYAGIAAMDCWQDAGFKLPAAGDETVHWDTAAIVGTGMGGADTFGELVVPRIDEGKVRRMGSTAVEQIMSSAPSAWIGGRLGLGGQVTSNSSACSTGLEAIIDAYAMVKQGRAVRALAGGTEGSSHYIWGGFDAMRVLSRAINDQPERASRPMSASAAGFVPSSGSGILMVEALESAQKRGARIYAEILGTHINCGGQRNGGSITAPSSAGVQRCIRKALEDARTRPSEIGLINGHLTATMADPFEVRNWSEALELSPERFPLIQSTKSLIGHGLGAAGGIEAVACVLQLARGFVHPTINCEDLHPQIAPFERSVPHECLERQVEIVAKASFGFGDVNACIILKRWNS